MDFAAPNFFCASEPVSAVLGAADAGAFCLLDGADAVFLEVSVLSQLLLLLFQLLLVLSQSLLDFSQLLLGFSQLLLDFSQLLLDFSQVLFDFSQLFELDLGGDDLEERLSFHIESISLLDLSQAEVDFGSESIQFEEPLRRMKSRSESENCSTFFLKQQRRQNCYLIFTYTYLLKSSTLFKYSKILCLVGYQSQIIFLNSS